MIRLTLGWAPLSPQKKLPWGASPYSYLTIEMGMQTSAASLRAVSESSSAKPTAHGERSILLVAA